MSREQDFLLGAIEKDKVIAQQQAQLIDADRRTLALQHENAQQQARIEELKLALDNADPLDPSVLRYLELEQQLQAERERAEKAEVHRDLYHQDALDCGLALKLTEDKLQAMREKLLEVEHLASRLAEMLAEIL